MDIKVNQAFSTILSILVFCYTLPSQFKQNQVNSSLAPLFSEHTLADIFFFLAERPQLCVGSFYLLHQIIQPQDPEMKPIPHSDFLVNVLTIFFLRYHPPPRPPSPPVRCKKRAPKTYCFRGSCGLEFTFVSTQYSQL